MIQAAPGVCLNLGVRSRNMFFGRAQRHTQENKKYPRIWAQQSIWHSEKCNQKRRKSLKNGTSRKSSWFLRGKDPSKNGSSNPFVLSVSLGLLAPAGVFHAKEWGSKVRSFPLKLFPPEFVLIFRLETLRAEHPPRLTDSISDATNFLCVVGAGPML